MKAKREVSININWKTAARIHLECVKHGSNDEVKKQAEAEIMRMAELLDRFVEEASERKD